MDELKVTHEDYWADSQCLQRGGSILFLPRLISHRLQRTIAIFLALLLVVGCANTTVQIPAEPDSIVTEVKHGDVVNIVTKDKKSLRFSVEKSSKDLLSGEGYSVPLDQISEIYIEKKKKSGETAKMVAIVVLAGLVGLAIAWGISELINSATDKAITGS